MANIKWDMEDSGLNGKEIIIFDKKSGAGIKLSPSDGVVFLDENKEYYIDLQKIHHVAMMQPRFFKKGIFAIYIDEKQYYVTEKGRPALFEVGNNQKYSFYFLHNILSYNKIKIKLC